MSSNLFPIPQNEQKIWKMYKDCQVLYWTASEINLSCDYYDWEKFSQDEKKFIKCVLSFLSTADTLVNINMVEKFMKIPVQSVRCFYGQQYAIQNTHSEISYLFSHTFLDLLE